MDSSEDPDSEPRAESGEHEEIDSILNSISTSIDWLRRLANMVRRAGTLRQNVKASIHLCPQRRARRRHHASAREGLPPLDQARLS